MPQDCLYYTISDATNQYMIRTGNMKRKYMAEYLSIGADEWIKIFQNTLFIVQNKWLPVKGSGPIEFYVDKPKGIEIFWGLFNNDECGRLAPLYYDQKMSVIPKPQESGCSCGKCNCGGLCGELNNFQVTTNPIVIGGNTYYEKVYLRHTGNGSIYEYRETPTAKYKDKVQAGDYNTDYNNDYLIDTGFQTYEVVTHVTSSLVCQLAVAPCGCPLPTPQNEEMFMTYCGCQVVGWNHKKYCDRFMKIINPNCRGEISFSEDGRRIIIRQNPNVPKPLRVGDWVLCRFQTKGITPGVEIIMPEYARERYWAGLNFEFMRFNGKYSISDKEYAKQQRDAEDDALVLKLNRLRFQSLAQLQDVTPKW